MRVLPEIKVERSDGQPCMPIEEAHARIREMASKMDARQRKHAAEQMLAGIRKIKEEEAAAAEKRKWLEAMEPIRDWVAAGIFVLEKNDCTRVHRLRDAALAGRVIRIRHEKAMDSDAAEAVFSGSLIPTFLVSHNWSSAFEGAEGLCDEFRLPADTCTFELRVSGRNVILLASDHPDRTEPRRAGLAIESGEYWAMCAVNDCWDRDDKLLELERFVWSHVRAICIALDADVATSEVVRAPVKLNEKRAKAGKTPLPDYRVVDLARRHRVANPLGATGTGTKKRLHFRRGHWRHFETSKTWVKWCLVGDPDLGFINKHYRL